VTSGHTSSAKQQATELKLLSKDTRINVCESAGVKQKAVFTFKEQLAMKSALKLTWSQSRTHKRFCRKLGIKYDSEKKERIERDTILQEQTLVSAMVDFWHRDENNPESVSGMVKKPTPLVYVHDLCNLVTQRLNAYHAAGQLIHDKFPDNEIWIKIGGDHGGGSFKMCIQIANILNPN
jgi:hypothetical protein